MAGPLARRFGDNPQFEGGRTGFLEESLESVHRQNQQSERERSGLSIEVALAQGFKYAANRRREHPQARSEARAYLADQAKEMLSACSFWFTKLTLVQALALWQLPDGEDRPGQPMPDYKELVADWSGMDGPRRRDRRHEHPFVVEAGRLAVRALETGQPERYMWIDESGVVSRVGSCPAKPHSRRKHNLWIPPSTGWTALNPRAQQLVADVLLLLNLAERGRPPQRDRRLQHTNKNHLPPCLAEDRFPLDPAGRWAWPGTSNPAPRAQTGCKFGLCPYPARGGQYYRQELSEAFCRRQQRLLARRAIRTRAAAWQEGSVRQLRRFWKEFGQPVQRAPNSNQMTPAIPGCAIAAASHVAARSEAADRGSPGPTGLGGTGRPAIVPCVVEDRLPRPVGAQVQQGPAGAGNQLLRSSSSSVGMADAVRARDPSAARYRFLSLGPGE